MSDTLPILRCWLVLAALTACDDSAPRGTETSRPRTPSLFDQAARNQAPAEAKPPTDPWLAQVEAVEQATHKASSSGTAGPLSADGADGWGAVRTDNYANRKLRYRYLVPKGPGRGSRRPVLVSVGGLSLPGLVPFEMKKFAERNGFVIIAPHFIWDERNWEGKTSYQYPSAWSGEALTKIIADFEEQQGVRTGKLFLFGVSAGAQFVLRYALHAPERVAAVSGYAPGTAIQLQHRVSPFFFVAIGEQDEERLDHFLKFRQSAEDLGINCENRIYSGLGHTHDKRLYKDTFAFFDKVLEQSRGVTRRPLAQ